MWSVSGTVCVGLLPGLGHHETLGPVRTLARWSHAVQGRIWNMAKRDIELTPDEISLLFLLASDPTREHFEEIRGWLRGETALDIGRILAGIQPEAVSATPHDVLRSVADEFKSRAQRAARGRKAAV